MEEKIVQHNRKLTITKLEENQQIKYLSIFQSFLIWGVLYMSSSSEMLIESTLHT